MRPEECAAASVFASRLPKATVRGVRSPSNTSQYLRSTAARPIAIWCTDPLSVSSASPSDVGVRGRHHRGTGQHAGSLADCCGGQNVHLSSHGEKRKVSSTLAGETLAPGHAVAEVEWLQMMLRDMMVGDVTRLD